MSKDGRRIDISLTVSPIRDGEGRIVGASKVARDITSGSGPRRRSGRPTAARTSSSRCWPTSCATRWPRCATACRCMRLAAGDANAVAQARGMMDRQLGHMVRLIDDLLDVSRISRNKMELRRSRLLLADVRQQRRRDGPARSSRRRGTSSPSRSRRSRSPSTPT